MKRSSFLSSIAALILAPFGVKAFAKKGEQSISMTKADIDTRELEALINRGAFIFGRAFLINRPIVITDDTKDFEIYDCRIWTNGDIPCFFDFSQRTKPWSHMVMVGNIFTGAPIGIDAVAITPFGEKQIFI